MGAVWLQSGNPAWTRSMIDAELHATGTDAEAGKSADRGKQKRHPVTTEQFTETSAGKAGTDGNNVWLNMPERVPLKGEPSS